MKHSLYADSILTGILCGVSCAVWRGQSVWVRRGLERGSEKAPGGRENFLSSKQKVRVINVKETA